MNVACVCFGSTCTYHFLLDISMWIYRVFFMVRKLIEEFLRRRPFLNTRMSFIEYSVRFATRKRKKGKKDAQKSIGVGCGGIQATNAAGGFLGWGPVKRRRRLDVVFDLLTRLFVLTFFLGAPGTGRQCVWLGRTGVLHGQIP